MTYVLLAASFVVIVVGAMLFTNAVEWAGEKLDLGHGAVGSLLAAIGTALPESLIPIVAVLAGEEGAQVAIGAIVGAPFMLGTVAMLMLAFSALVFRDRRETGTAIEVERGAVRRDLGLFLPAFAVGLAVGLIDSTAADALAVAGLLAAYGFHVWQTVRASEGAAGDELRPLHFDTSKEDPPNAAQIGAQLVVGLAAIIGGAELFVEEITTVAEHLSVSPLVLSLVIAPLATELPEKMNSVIWMRRNKDQLAVGNITGAMAFQSTVPIALGIVITDWNLGRFAIAAGVLGLAGGALAWWRLERRQFGPVSALAWSALFGALIVFVVVG